MEQKSAQIVSINVGKPQPLLYEGGEVQSGIVKQETSGPLYLTKLNFEGDGQADLKYHGGPDKAVCVYSWEHYPYWVEKMNRQLGHAAFGENLTVAGMLEPDVCIGDIYQLGEAVVQVTQPRQPCHKLAKLYHLKELPVWVQDSGYTGFYFRVLEEGLVTKEEPIRLLERNRHEISVQFANQIMHHDKHNLEAIERILQVEELSGNWRKTFSKRLGGEETETKQRLEG